MPTGRYLRKNHATQGFSRLIFWDTETTPLATSDPNIKDHVLRLGVARSVKRENNKATRRKTLHYKSNEEFWEWVIDHLSEKQPLYMFAHNIGFDLTISGFWGKLDDGTFVLSRTETTTDKTTGELKTKIWKGCFCDNDPPTIITVLHAETGCKITFLDSMNYYRHSLRAIGDKLGVPKLEMPDWEASDEEWFNYCENDVIVLEQAILTLMDWFRDNDYGNFKLTQASLSMAAFRHRFYSHGICLDNESSYENIERDSYYGGRLELFRMGEIPGMTYQLDVNSQYPSVMHNNLFPVERITHSRKSTVEMTPEKLTVEYIATVRVKTDVSRYPLRVKGIGTIYPTGQFITTLAGPELQFAKRNGDILEVYDWARYRLEPVFRRFVSHFWGRRKEAKERNDNVEDYFLKILMNSLYGKFGQQTPEWEDLDSVNDLPQWVQGFLAPEEYEDFIEQPNPTAPQYLIWKKQGEHKQVKYRTIGKHCQMSQERKPHRNSFCAISSFVTSYARAQMNNLIDIAGRENVYYVVTDAVFTSYEGFRRLQSAGRVGETGLGKLSIEAKGTNARFDALHHYRLGEKRRRGSRTSKGVVVCPDCSQPVGDDDTSCISCGKPIKSLRTVETKFTGIRGVLRSESKDRIRVSRIVKNWGRSYDRGRVDDVGIVTPLRYTVARDRNVRIEEL